MELVLNRLLGQKLDVAFLFQIKNIELKVIYLDNN